MTTEKFYDPEDISRSWSEINGLDMHKATRSEKTLLEYLDLLYAVRWMLPRVLAYYSEELWCAGWYSGIEEWATDKFPEIETAAQHLGALCTYWDGTEDSAGEWREY